MHRVTPEGRWTAPPEQFAARIRSGDLPGVLSKKLLVDFGTRAVLLEEGEILGELPPGIHTLDSLAERLTFEPRRQTAVIVLREEEVALRVAETVLGTRDGQTVRVSLRANVQADDVILFLENVLGAREYLTLDELRSLLAPVLTEQLREAVGQMTLGELVQADAHDRLAAMLGDGGETLQHYGFRLGPVLAISIRLHEQPSEPAIVPDATSAGHSSPSLSQQDRLRRSGRRTIRCPEPGTEALSRPEGEPREPEPDAVAAGSVLVNSLGMRLALLPPGRFLMGSPPEEPERSGAEDQHVVEIGQPFHLGVFPVTQEEYRSMMGTDPSCFAEPETPGSIVKSGGGLPVDRVSWDDACEFCRRLSELPAEKAAGRFYRLPTEAEWEYACRAGTTTAFAFGPSLSAAQANFDGRSTTPVGSFQPNAWGLCDMHGNLWEWCEDWFSPDYYRRSPSRDPKGPATGFARVLRGGSWRSRAGQCRSAARYSATPTHRHDAFGFRVVCISQ